MLLRELTENQKEKLCDILTENYSNDVQQFLSSPLTEKQIEGHRQWRRGFLSQARRLHALREENDIKFYATAQKVNQDWGTEIVRIAPILGKLDAIFEDELFNFIDTVEKEWPGIPVDVMLTPVNFDKQHLFLKRGYKFTNKALVGKVEDALSALSKTQSGSSDFSFQIISERDIDTALRLEQSAHQAEPAARNGYTDTETGRKRLREYYVDICADQNGFFLIHESKPIGLISLHFPNREPLKNSNFHDLPLISGIALQPDWWGRGLSKKLYFKGISLMKERGFSHYVGNSTTPRVLNLADAFSRKIYQLSLGR